MAFLLKSQCFLLKHKNFNEMYANLENSWGYYYVSLTVPEDAMISPYECIKGSIILW